MVKTTRLPITLNKDKPPVLYAVSSLFSPSVPITIVDASKIASGNAIGTIVNVKSPTNLNNDRRGGAKPVPASVTQCLPAVPADLRLLKPANAPFGQQPGENA